jgi:TusA-related sulfurtransferase
MGDARHVDALGTHCPVPVRLLAQAIARVPPGATVRVLADDPLVVVDLPAWCHAHGHELVAFDEAEGTWTAVVRHRARVGA